MARMQPKPFGFRKAFVSVYADHDARHVGGYFALASWTREQREGKERAIYRFNRVKPLYRINLRTPRKHV